MRSEANLARDLGVITYRIFRTPIYSEDKLSLVLIVFEQNGRSPA